MIDLGADAATARAIQKSAAAAHASQSQALPQLVRRLDLRGYLMYRSGLVPRRMAVLGLIGGPLIIASGTAVLFDVIQPGSAAQVIATIPEFVWELSLGIYLMVKGFKPSPILSGTIGDAGADERSPALAASGW